MFKTIVVTVAIVAIAWGVQLVITGWLPGIALILTGIMLILTRRQANVHQRRRPQTKNTKPSSRKRHVHR
jgi:predicted phage tail protein